MSARENAESLLRQFDDMAEQEGLTFTKRPVTRRLAEALRELLNEEHA